MAQHRLYFAFQIHSFIEFLSHFSASWAGKVAYNTKIWHKNYNIIGFKIICGIFSMAANGAEQIASFVWQLANGNSLPEQ